MILASSSVKTKKKEQKRSHHILSFMFGYHDDGYKPTMLGLYTHLSWKKGWKKIIKNHVNVVPNAWLTRKMVVPRASHVNLIIAFSMHKHKHARVIHLYEMWLTYWRSKFLFLGLWGWTKHMFFKERFIKSRSSMEVTGLRKLGQEMDRLALFLCLLPTHNWATLQKNWGLLTSMCYF